MSSPEHERGPEEAAMPDSCPGPSGGPASLQERLHRTCTKGCNGCSLIPETANRARGRAVDGRPASDVANRPVTDSSLPAQVAHLALNALLGDRLASEDIPGVRRHPDPPTSDREDRPEEACPSEEPDRDEKGVNRQIDHKMGPKTRLRPKPLHCPPPQLILSSTTVAVNTTVGRLVDLVLGRHRHRLLSPQRVDSTS